MQAQESWYQSAADRGRRRLFPRGIVGLFALAMLLVGALALPSKHLHERLANAHETDLLTVAYLNAWVNAAPHDLQIQLTLARHQALLGSNKQALESLGRLIGSGVPSIARSARRLRLNVLERMLYELSDLDPRRAALLARVRAELEVVAADVTDPIEIEAMMRRAEGLDHPVLVARLLARLVGFGSVAGVSDTDSLSLPKGKRRSVEQFARQAIGLGDFRLAAALYWRAFDEAQTHERQLELLMQVARAEQAGNRLGEFFVALESRLDGLTLDTERYRVLARLALAANRLDLAERFARKMLKFSGWWKGWGVSEARQLLRTSWQWLSRGLAAVSPIRTAHAQELDEAIELLHQPVTRVKPAPGSDWVNRSWSNRAQAGASDSASGGELDENPSPSTTRVAEVPVVEPVDPVVASANAPHQDNGTVAARPSAIPALIQVPARVKPASGFQRANRPRSKRVSEGAVDSASGGELYENPSPSTTRVAEVPAVGPLDSVVVSANAPHRVNGIVAARPSATPGLNPAPDSDSTSASGGEHYESPMSVTAPTATAPQPERTEPVFADAPNWGARIPETRRPLASTPSHQRSARNQSSDLGTDSTSSATSAIQTLIDDPLGQLIGQLDARAAVSAAEPAASDHATMSVLPPRFRLGAPVTEAELNGQIPNAPSWVASRAVDPSLIAGNGTQGGEDPDALRERAIAEDKALADSDSNLLLESVPASGGSRFSYSTSAIRSDRPPKERPQLAFDQNLYLLAYQVFLAGANIDDAYAVALAAVDQRPELTEWRIRLAQTAQWSQRPVVALAQWKILARKFGKREYWDNVASLAGGVRDDASVLTYLKWVLSRNPNDIKAIVEVSRTYERMGNPRRAIEWIQQRAKRMSAARAEPLYEELANLAQKVGDAKLLIQTLSMMSEKIGIDTRRAMRLSAAQYAQGNVAAAFGALQAAAEEAADPEKHNADAEKEIGFWSNYADLARVMQRRDDAIRGYQRVLSLGVYSADNLTVISSILENKSLSAAAEVMSLAYFRYLNGRYARRAVSLWVRDGRLDLAESFMNQLGEKVRASLLQSVEFLSQRAAYYQSVGKLKLAIADLTTIHRLAPNDMGNRAAMIWALLANRDAPRLRTVLRRWESVARDEPGLWGPFGAGLLGLGEPNRALKYFVWQARERDDYLWWLAYADALDASGRVDAAWTLRRRAWTELRKDGVGQLAESPEKKERIIGLAMRFAPADEARRLLAGLFLERRAVAPEPKSLPGDAPGRTRMAMTADVAGSATAGISLANVLDSVLNESTAGRGAAGDRVSSLNRRARRSVASELAVSYLLSNRNVEPARAWLLSRYAKDLAKPAWAQLSIALVNHDNTELERLLDTMPDWLPKLDRIEALQRLGRVAEAQTMAYDTLTARPDSEPAHKRLVDAMMAEDQPSAGLSTVSSAQGVLDIRTNRADAALRVDQHGKAYFFAESGSTDSVDPTILRNANTSTRNVGVGLNWKRAEGSWMAELSQRKGIESNTAMRGRWQRMFSPMFDVTVTGGLNQPTAELPALTVGGQKDYVDGQVTVNLTGRDYLTGYLGLGQLETQLGTKVATTSRFSLEYGHRLRFDYPDVTLRAQFTSSKYTKTNAVDPIMTRLAPLGALNPVDSFVPASSRQLDLFVNVGQAISNRYTRALRFFGEAGLSVNSVSGSGFSLRGGLSSSVFGSDRLTLYGSLTGKSPGNSRRSSELGLSYRLHY